MEECSCNGQSKSSAAKKRWKMLSRSLLKQKIGRFDTASGETDVSVRRFTGFEILHYCKIEADDFGTWFSVDYECSKTVQIRLLHSRVDPEVLIGFNNTGNVCIWPAEEVMAQYCINDSVNFNQKRICEIGGGMTSLAGLILATNIDAEVIHLTDGNMESVKNIQAILDRNQEAFLTKAVTTGQLIWGSPSEDEKTQKFDFVLCADCLFFVEYHQDLIDTIYGILCDEGKAVIFAPKRGNTLELFVNKAKKLFDIKVEEEYDKEISEKYELCKNNPAFDEDIHYPLLVKMKKRVK